MTGPVTAVLTVARLSASAALICLETASALLEISTASIALVGLVPLGLVAYALGSKRDAHSPASSAGRGVENDPPAKQTPPVARAA